MLNPRSILLKYPIIIGSVFSRLPTPFHLELFRVFEQHLPILASVRTRFASTSVGPHNLQYPLVDSNPPLGMYTTFESSLKTPLSKFHEMFSTLLTYLYWRRVILHTNWHSRAPLHAVETAGHWLNGYGAKIALNKVW